MVKVDTNKKVGQLVQPSVLKLLFDSPVWWPLSTEVRVTWTQVLQYYDSEWTAWSN